MRRRLAAALLVLAAVVVPLAGPAAADGIAIRRVDTTAFPDVRVEVAGVGADGSRLAVEEDRRPVALTDLVPAARAGAFLVAVVDTSSAMAADARVDRARELVRRLVATAKPGDAIGVVAAGATATVVQAPTSDLARLDPAVAALGAAGPDAHLDDAVRLGAGLLDGHDGTLVVVTASADHGSTGTFEAARATALSSHAAVLVVGITGGSLDRAALQGLAAATAGAYHEVPDPIALPAVAGDVRADLAGRWTATYRSTAVKPFDVAAVLGEQRVEATQVVPGEATATGAKTWKPTASVGPLRGSAGVVIVALLVLAAAAAVAIAVALLVLPGGSALDDALEAYTLDRPVERQGADEGYARTAIIQRAVALTEKVARRRDLLGTMERRLEQAAIKLRAGEVLFFSAAVIGLVVLLALAFLPPIVALLIGVLSVYAPVAVLNLLAARRRRKFVSQLPDTLNLLAATLRSGYALLQGVTAIVGEVSDPMGAELRRVLVEAQLGRDLDDALTDCADRMQSPDFEWAVMAIGIQREVGGNLAELLDTVADTMLQRERLRRDVSALVAEGKMSAIVLGAMPPGLGFMMFVINREYVMPLFTDSLGNVMLAVSTVWALFGFWWMKKTITIEI